MLIPFTGASTTSKRSIVCSEVQQLVLRKGNALKMDPAHALTEFYCVHAARSIADNARKTDAMVTLGGCCFVYTRFRGIVTQERHRLSHLLYGS